LVVRFGHNGEQQLCTQVIREHSEIRFADRPLFLNGVAFLFLPRRKSRDDST
jgi:hypothetical protein